MRRFRRPQIPQLVLPTKQGLRHRLDTHEPTPTLTVSRPIRRFTFVIILTTAENHDLHNPTTTMASDADHETLVLRLLEFVPNATPEQATQYLSANSWDLDAAAASLMADAEEAEEDATTEAGPASSSATAGSAPAPAGYTGPRTLDGRPAPNYSSSSASSAKKTQPKKKGLATLSSLGGGGHGHDHDDDDSEDDEDDPHRDTYAGGEKSGLAVQDPNSSKSNAQRILDDLLAKAKS